MHVRRVIKMEPRFRPSSHPRKVQGARILWSGVWWLLFRPSPRWMFGWRAALLSCFGARLGRDVRVYPSARIWAPWNLTMGDRSCLGSGVNCYNCASIEIGENAVVSQSAYLCTASHDYNSTDFPFFSRPISIGDHAWVCTEAFLGPGVRVEAGAVVGARAAVFRAVPAWSVVGGNPARLLRSRQRPVGQDGPRLSSGG